ncbi:FeoA family protein, partial [Staphylococcus felis]
NNQYEEIHRTPILEFETGTRVVIRRVRDKTELLVYLSSKSIKIGDEVTISKKDDINQMIELKNDTDTIILSYQNANYIFAERIE